MRSLGKDMACPTMAMVPLRDHHINWNWGRWLSGYNVQNMRNGYRDELGVYRVALSTRS